MTKWFRGVAVLFGLVMIEPAFAQTSTSPSPGAPPGKMTEAQCEVVWMRIDAAKAGTVSQPQSQNTLADFKAADTNDDGVVSRAEFLVACDKGNVSSGSASTGTGTRTGASSGTGTSPPKQ